MTHPATQGFGEGLHRAGREKTKQLAQTHTHTFPPSSILAPVSLPDHRAMEILALLSTLHHAHRGPSEPLPVPPQHPARTRSSFTSTCQES